MAAGIGSLILFPTWNSPSKMCLPQGEGGIHLEYPINEVLQVTNLHITQSDYKIFSLPVIAKTRLTTRYE